MFGALSLLCEMPVAPGLSRIVRFVASLVTYRPVATSRSLVFPAFTAEDTPWPAAVRNEAGTARDGITMLPAKPAGRFVSGHRAGTGNGRDGLLSAVATFRSDDTERKVAPVRSQCSCTMMPRTFLPFIRSS
jgi:hypothetical protein